MSAASAFTKTSDERWLTERTEPFYDESKSERVTAKLLVQFEAAISVLVWLWNVSNSPNYSFESIKTPEMIFSSFYPCKPSMLFVTLNTSGCGGVVDS
jgi:hypothetical protein